MPAKKKFTLLAVLAITLILLEVALRVSGLLSTINEKTLGEYRSPYNQHFPSWFFIHAGNTSFKNTHPEFSYLHKVDSNGLIRTNTGSRSDDTLRVLVMGDSFTFGFGAPMDSSWPVLLTTIFKSRCAGAVEVINASMPGSDVLFEFMLYKEKLSKTIKPDIVLIMINSTDIQEVAVRGGMERFKQDGTTVTKKAPWFEPFYHYSYVARYLLKMFGIDNEFLFRSKKEDGIFDKAAEKIKNCITEFEKEATNNNTTFIVLPCPMPYEFSKKTKQLEIYSNKLRENKNVYFALDTMLRDYYKEHDIHKDYWPIDGHLNSNGYRVLAENVYEVLLRKNTDVRTVCAK